MKNCLIICLLSFTACQHKEVTNNKNDKIDSLKKTLIGEWGGREGKPVWKITYDSIIFHNNNESYQYSIVGNDFIVHTNKTHFKFKDISVNEDTLLFYSPANIQQTAFILTKSFRYK